MHALWESGIDNICYALVVLLSAYAPHKFTSFQRAVLTLLAGALLAGGVLQLLARVLG